MYDLAKIIIFSVKHSIKNYCKSNKKKLNKLLLIAPCVNTHISKGATCLNEFMEKTKQLINVKSANKDKIKYACWLVFG